MVRDKLRAGAAAFREMSAPRVQELDDSPAEVGEAPDQDVQQLPQGSQGPTFAQEIAMNPHVIENRRKAKEASDRLEKRQTDAYNKMEKLDVKKAHARCFAAGNHGTIAVGGGGDH